MPDDKPARGLLSGNDLPDAAAFSDMEAAVFLHRRMQRAVSEGRTGVYGMSELDMGSCLPVLRFRLDTSVQRNLLVFLHRRDGSNQ